MHGHHTRCRWQDWQGMQCMQHPGLQASQSNHQIYVHDVSTLLCVGWLVSVTRRLMTVTAAYNKWLQRRQRRNFGRWKGINKLHLTVIKQCYIINYYGWANIILTVHIFSFFVLLKLSEKTGPKLGSFLFLTPMCIWLNKLWCANGLLKTYSYKLTSQWRQCKNWPKNKWTK